jgi:hypothetical protein
MIRKVTFYWILCTLVLIDSWLLSKPNILGKIGLLIYKYHYLRSFPRTLLTVWIATSTCVLIVFIVQYLLKQEKMSRLIATVVLAACAVGSLLILGKVYLDFTSWSYSNSGLKFRYGAYLLPLILAFIFISGLMTIPGNRKASQEQPGSHSVEPLQPQHNSVSHGTSLPLQP